MGTDLQDRIHSTQFPSHDQNRAIVLSLSLSLCPFATISHCIAISFCCGCVNKRIFLSPPISTAILFCKHKYCRCVCMALHHYLCPPALTVCFVFDCMQARCATNPTPSSQTCADTSACTLTVGLRSSVKTVVRCLVPLLPSTNTAASVKAKTILLQPQEGSLALEWLFLALPEWTSRL